MFLIDIYIYLLLFFVINEPNSVRGLRDIWGNILWFGNYIGFAILIIVNREYIEISKLPRRFI